MTTFAIERPDFNGLDLNYNWDPVKKKNHSTRDQVLAQFSDRGATSKILKVGGNALNLASKIPGGIPPQTELLSHLDTFGGAFASLNIIRSTKELFSPSVKVKPLDITKDKKIEKRRIKREKAICILHRIKSALGLASAGMIGVKLSAKFGAFKLADISVKWGPFYSFNLVSSLVGTLRISLEIATTSLKLAALNEKVKHIKAKRAFWKQMEPDAIVIEQRCHHLAGKMLKVIKQAEVEQIKLIETKFHFAKQLQAYKATGKNRKALFQTAHTQNRLCEKISALQNQLQGLVNKRLQWREANQLSEIKKAKLQKWKVKAQHIKNEQIMTGLNLASQIIVAICLIALLVITGLGAHFLAISLTIGALFLLSSSSSLATHFVRIALDQKKKKNPIPKVNRPLS